MTSLIVVSPMQIESRALGGIKGVRTHVCGPGPAAVRGWAASVEDGATVILAGVAGGLVPSSLVGHARTIREVWLSSGSIARPQIHSDGPTWRVAGSDRLVATRDAKRDLAARSGADIVDMESHAFVVEASRRRWRYAIVRGVSDAHDEELPVEIESLVDARGRARVVAATALLLRHPSLLGPLRALGRRTEDAMTAVATIVRSIVETERSK